MSIKLMSAIFETEFPDYLSCGEMKTKASTAKLVLLAIADHANDYGESAYPGLTKLEKKTGLSRQGIVDTLKVLKFNGLLLIDEEPSRLKTNNYTVVIQAYPTMTGDVEEGSQATLLVKPLDQPSQATLPEVVKPLDSNHSLITNKTSKESLKKEIAEKGGVGWQVAGGVPSEEIVELDKTFALRKERTDEYERVMGYNPLNWGSKELAPLEKFLAKQSLEDIRRFAIWSKREYSTLNPAKARQYPRLVIDLWPQACPPIEVRKPEPPKEKEVYLSGEELVRRLKGEK